jgi:pimeloyl-ACP methyl ester carboxylesterase
MTAPTLVLLPGLLCDRDVWAPQIAALESDYEIVVPDLWGYDSFDAMAEAALAEAPARFSLAGHSMGGRVALEIMRRAPERVERLALLSTGVHPVREAEVEPRLAQVALAEREGIEALVQEWLPPMLHPRHRDDPKLVGSIVSMWCRGTPEIFAKQIHAALHRRDLRPLLAGIRCPTLVIVGAEDTWSPPAQHNAIAAAIPNAELAIVPESGHMVTLEAPDRVNAELRRWLARQSTFQTQEA